nr:hypothetical protein [Tanacetum cinerariifolium]
MANLEFCDKHNMVTFLKKPQGSEDFHQIVDFLKASHIRYALTKNPTIYVSLINQFRRTASVRTLDNREIELNATVDGHGKTITEASIRRHLKLADANSISTLPTTGIFKQLALMGYVTDSDKLTFQKDEAITKEIHDGLGRATTIVSSLEAEQGGGNISKTQTKATPSGPSSLRTSSEGGLGCHFTKGNSHVQARPERLSNLPNEPTLGEVIDTSKEEEASLDHEDSPKQRRIIEEIDKDENVNLVKSSKQGEAHETGKHIIDFSTTSPQIDDDETLTETLLNIKRSAAKDKGKARLAQENLAQAEQWDDVQAQIQADEDLAQRMLEEERESLSIKERFRLLSEFIDNRKKMLGATRAEEKRNKEQNVEEENAQQEDVVAKQAEKESSNKARVRLKRKTSKAKEDKDKRQKKQDDPEKLTLIKCVEVISDSKEVINVIPLAIKTPIVNWKSYYKGDVGYYEIHMVDESYKAYIFFSEMLNDFDREDMILLYRLFNEKYASTRPGFNDLII